MKKERGITLVALVITVIVMLILAGVALSLITGEDGLFARANHSAQKYKDASQTEADKVGQLINSEYMGGEGSGPTEPTKPDIPEPNITTTYIPETNINPSIYNGGKGVKVEITDNTNSEYQLQYSTDEGLSWYDYIPGETEIYVAEYNGVVLAQLYDKATGTAGESTTINVTNIDTLAPEEFNYTEGEKTENTITISGSAKDRVGDTSASSEVKYKYAIQSTKTEPTWESIEETTETEKTFDKVTEGGASLQAETTYYVYMLAIDEAGNITKAGNNGTEIATDSAPALITELAKSGKLKVGDYIDYDAGKWTAQDLDKIKESLGNPTLHSTVDDVESGNQLAPEEQGQFGGFEINQSRNSNSKEHKAPYVPKAQGWRIWSIDENSGEVTIIHAGHSETYYHQNGKAVESMEILENRDCSMYENKYAVEGSAHFLKGSEAAEWYTKNCLTEDERVSNLRYELESYNEDLDNDQAGDNNFYYAKGLSEFVKPTVMPVIEVLENGAYYWFVSASNINRLYGVTPASNHVYTNVDWAHGVRVVIHLNSNILLKKDKEEISGWQNWTIVEN